jgi:cobalt-zinc-cadmium efflux system outer membrane protein
MKLLAAWYRFTLPVAFLASLPVEIARAGEPPPSVAAPAEPVEAAAAGTLSLADAIDAALRHSPELASDRAEAAAIGARSAQADLWLNPEIDLMVENVAGSGDFDDIDRSETTLTVAQPIEIGGQRAQRRRVIESGGRRLDTQMQAHRLALIAEVKKRFLRVLLGQERRQLVAEVEELSSETLRAVEARVKAGAAAPAERSQVRILLGRARLDLHLAEHEIAAARRQLAAMWGDSQPSFTAVGKLEDIGPPPPLDELMARLEHSPEILRRDAEIERRAAAIDIERANRIPTVTLAAGARHFNETDDFAAIFDVSLPLPLFDRNQGGILEAEHLLVKARAERDAALLQARSELLAAYDDLQLQFEHIAQLGIHVLSQAKTAGAETLQSYRRGAATALDLLASQRVLLELQDEYFQALGKYQTALVDVERLTAASADGRVQP